MKSTISSRNKIIVFCTCSSPFAMVPWTTENRGEEIKDKKIRNWWALLDSICFFLWFDLYICVCIYTCIHTHIKSSTTAFKTHLWSLLDTKAWKLLDTPKLESSWIHYRCWPQKCYSEKTSAQEKTDDSSGDIFIFSTTNAVFS